MEGNIKQGDTTLDVRVATSKIYTRNVTKSYKTKQDQVVAIQDINIDILENEFVCIVGPSGCGKSTLLRILGGLEEATSGDIFIDDRRLKGAGADRGMVFQGYTLFPWLTVEDNIRFGLKIKKMPKEKADEITEKYLKLVDLAPFRKCYPKQLSGGMKQRVAIARALANSPEVLLMDEPFGALDQQTKASMQEFMRQIWTEEKPTVVFITHDIEEAVFLANRIYVMDTRPGRIKENMPVLLPYNRTLDIKDTREFIDLRKYVTSILHKNEPEEEKLIGPGEV